MIVSSSLFFLFFILFLFCAAMAIANFLKKCSIIWLGPITTFLGPCMNYVCILYLALIKRPSQKSSANSIRFIFVILPFFLFFLFCAAIAIANLLKKCSIIWVGPFTTLLGPCMNYVYILYLALMKRQSEKAPRIQLGPPYHNFMFLRFALSSLFCD